MSVSEVDFPSAGKQYHVPVWCCLHVKEPFHEFFLMKGRLQQRLGLFFMARKKVCFSLELKIVVPDVRNITLNVKEKFLSDGVLVEFLGVGSWFLGATSLNSFN